MRIEMWTDLGVVSFHQRSLLREVFWALLNEIKLAELFDSTTALNFDNAYKSFVHFFSHLVDNQHLSSHFSRDASGLNMQIPSRAFRCSWLQLILWRTGSQSCSISLLNDIYLSHILNLMVHLKWCSAVDYIIFYAYEALIRMN